MIISQFLAIDAHVKRSSIDNDQGLTRNIVKDLQTPRCPSPPITPLVAQLIEMGFSKRAIERAITATSDRPETDVDRLVAWLLENPSEDTYIAGERLNSSEKTERGTCKELSVAAKVRIYL